MGVPELALDELDADRSACIVCAEKLGFNLVNIDTGELC